MTARDYLLILRGQWLLVLLATVAALGVSIAVFLVRPTEFTASTSLYVSAQGSQNLQQAYQGAQLSEQRVRSYTELVNSGRVLGDVVARLQLPMSPADLADDVSAASNQESVIIDISATAGTARQAAELADTVASVTADVVADLETPQQPGGTPSVALRVVQAAEEPAAPSSASWTTVLALGFLVGVTVGAVGAIVRHSLDNTVNSVERLKSASKAPNLGSIVFDSNVAHQPIAINDDDRGQRAEAYRQIRTNLQYIDVDAERKVVLCTSAIAGEGKSTTVANLAAAVSLAGARVLVIEADLRRPGISGLLGFDRSVGLVDVLSGRVRLDSIIQFWHSGAFDFIASGPIPPNPSELLASRSMQNLLSEVRGRYDLVLIDSPPVLPVTDAIALAPYCDGTVLVCRYKITKTSQVEATADALRAVNTTVLGTVLSGTPSSGVNSYSRYAGSYEVESVPPSGGPSVSRPSVDQTATLRNSAIPPSSPRRPPVQSPRNSAT